MRAPPSVIFGHDSFAVAFVDLRYSEDPYFARVGLDGTKLLKPVREATSPWASSGVVLGFDGNDFAMVWREERNDRPWIAFAVVDQDGKEVVAPKLLELGADPCCFSLAWTGEVYGLAWRDQQRLLFAELTATGEVLTPEINLGTPTGTVQQTAMAWGQGMFHFALVADERFNDGNDNWTNRQALSTSTVTCRP